MAVAFDRYGKFDPVQGMKDIEDLLKDLKSRPGCNGKVAMLGFCFGGRFAMPRKQGDEPAAFEESRERVLRCFKSM
jgi:hypothetical protein